MSAPAVNKWERNNSYPDITLLPPLARLLEVDLNTLLSFQEELTEEEIGAFANVLGERAQQEGCGGRLPSGPGQAAGVPKQRPAGLYGGPDTGRGAGALEAGRE